jgi:MoxR-like ATPase
LGRPLLLTGEPGCGKTDFAFAAASGLCGDKDDQSYKPLQFYVRSDTAARDLLYRYDAVRRFADAQTGETRDRERARLPQNYVALEALGEALISPIRRVILVDEIDKAQRDLPNDLLRELDQNRFDIPEIDHFSDERRDGAEADHRHLRRRMEPSGSNTPKPLVIITSNVERQLPDAFLRRCLFYYVPFPTPTRLLEVLNARFGEQNASQHGHAVDLFMKLRSLSVIKKPATAELVDWVQTLQSVFDSNYVSERLGSATVSELGAEAVNWLSLPALTCLIKLKEDLELLGRFSGSS